MMVEAAEKGDPSLYGEMNEEEKAEYERLRKCYLEFNEEFERGILRMRTAGESVPGSGEEEKCGTDGGERNDGSE